MTFFHLFILAIVQGITEFLPISSSAHLVLMHEMGTSPAADALALDVAVHLGSIVAVCLYFRADFRRLLAGTGQLLRGQLGSPESFLAFALVVATVPALILGALLAVTGWVDLLRNATVIGWMMIIFGVLLWWAHRVFPERRKAHEWRLKDALIMGLWQAVALVPGVSRSGITMTAGRMLGFDRHDATRLAMLMSIPITLATGGYLLMKLPGQTLDADLWWQLGIGAVLSFGAAWVALAVMMRFLSVVSYTPYVIYRVILGAVLLMLAYS
ncbi:MAG: undecaprenyl-diphosphate phosphatase [Pararhodobacter sp.]|nr:undecaprenyl-diphosphate phosphatase [Pararhodobacter sp.]